MSLRNAPRSALAVFLCAVLVEQSENESGLFYRGISYRGLRTLLHINSDSAVRQAVRKAREAGLISVVQAGGAGGISVIRAIPRQRDLFLTRVKGNK